MCDIKNMEAHPCCASLTDGLRVDYSGAMHSLAEKFEI